MKVTFSLILIVAISALAFKSRDSNDTEKVLTAYLESYNSQPELTGRMDTIFILNKNTTVLEKTFLPRLINKSRKHKELSSALSQKEVDFLKHYEIQSYERIYKAQYDNPKAIFLDSITFYNKQNYNFFGNNRKIEFRGPFFTENKQKALLEVYLHPNCLGGSYVILTKEKEDWKILGYAK